MDNQRVRITKQLLKDSLIKLLQEKPLKKISISDICSMAQINRSTFYRHYGSQYELLDDIERDIFQKIEEYMMEKCDNVSMLTRMLTFVEKNNNIFKVLMNHNIDEDFVEKLSSIPSVTAVIHDEFKNSNYNDSEYIYQFVLRGGYEIIRVWLNKENHEQPIKLAEIIEDIASKTR